MDIRKK